MKKYIAVIDWKTNYKNGFDHFELEAKTILEAMDEAESLWNDDVYLISLAEKTGKQRDSAGVKAVDYTTIMADRGSGWRTWNDSHSVWTRCSLAGSTWYEVNCQI